MLVCVHSHTTHGGPDAQIPAAASFAKLTKVMVDIAGHANGRTGLAVNSSNLTALQLDKYVQRILLLVQVRRLYNRAKGASAPTKLPTAALTHPNIEDHRTRWDHVKWKTVAAHCRPRGDQGRIVDASDGVNQRLWNASKIALDRVAFAEAVAGENIRLLLRLNAVDQSDMRASARVVLDALHAMFSRVFALCVDHSDASLGTSAAMSNRYLSRVVPPSNVLAFAREGKLTIGATFPQMVVDRPYQVALSRRSRLVPSQHQVDGRYMGAGVPNDCSILLWERRFSRLGFALAGGLLRCPSDVGNAARTGPRRLTFR